MRNVQDAPDYQIPKMCQNIPVVTKVLEIY